MRIVCPKCELKGQVDVATASAKMRIACVRCATTFDAISADGQIQVLLPQASHVEMALERVGSDVPAIAPETASPVETQEESQLDFASQTESTPAPTDDSFASSTDVSITDVSIEETLETSESAWAQETAKEPVWQSVGTQSQETPVVEQAVSFVEPPVKSVGVNKAGQPSDAYGLGVRLMRVSPMCLLLAGLSFISFIVLCNWLIKPGEQTGDTARMLVATDNHATNQSPSRVVVPDSTTQSPVNSQPAQPATQSGVSFIPTEATEATASKATAQGAETIVKPAAEEKPAVEEKKASPSSSTNAASEAQAGKLTIQIGSYNEAAQADERVANLKSAGYEARSVAVEIPKRGTWYRVQSGRFVNRDEAERYGKQLREKGVVSSYITTDVQE
ncbi:MAG TPA: SPOR domain-containing protein [Pyrinomonadaceae bacterium]|jgi:cell division septation protein DedD